MSIKTGIFRIAQVAKWLGSIVFACCVVAGIYSAFTGHESRSAVVDFLSPVFFGGVAYLICRALAWVLEGFAKD